MKYKITIIGLFLGCFTIGQRCPGRDRSAVVAVDTLNEYEFSCQKIMPNPMDQSTGVCSTIKLPESCSVTINILDTALNPVYQFNKLELAPGKYEIFWLYERNRDGQEIKPGIYYVDVMANSADTTVHNVYSCRHRFLAVPTGITD